MSSPLNQGLYSNNSVGAFRSSGLPLNSSQPSNISYGSLPDTGSRPPFTNSAPMPPPRTQRPLYSNSCLYNNSYSGYGGYGSYGYGSYGSVFNRPIMNSYSPYYQQNYMNPVTNSQPLYDSSFIQEAQESSREAFSGIEGIVNTFGSVNMMIESTYYALQSSFNAVLSVAENFSRLRLQFGQILSAFALLRTFQWLYRKLLYLIGLRAVDPSAETAWRTASRSLEEFEATGGPRRSSWPMIMFLIVVYAGPFLMWKFVNSIMRKGKSKDSWVRENGDYYYAIAKYNYTAQSNDELSFSAGDYLKLAPYEKQTDKSWPLASDGKRTGIIPVNYVDIKFKSAKSNNYQPPVTKSPFTSNPHLNTTVNTWAGEALRNQTNPSQTPIPTVHEQPKIITEDPSDDSTLIKNNALSDQATQKEGKINEA